MGGLVVLIGGLVVLTGGLVVGGLVAGGLVVGGLVVATTGGLVVVGDGCLTGVKGGLVAGGIDIFTPGTTLMPPNPENKPATESLTTGGCVEVTIGNPPGRVKPDKPL